VTRWIQGPDRARLPVRRRRARRGGPGCPAQARSRRDRVAAAAAWPLGIDIVRGRSFAQRRDAAIIAVLTATGIRTGELAGIRYDPHDPRRSDVDLWRREPDSAGRDKPPCCETASRSSAPTPSWTPTKAVLVPCSISSAAARPEPWESAHSNSAIPGSSAGPGGFDRGPGGSAATAPLTRLSLERVLSPGQG